MGILVPDLALERIGMTLPTAYVAVSKNRVTITPLAANVYRIATTFSVWTSREARQADKAPADTVSVNLVWDTTNASTVQEGYTLIYDEVKKRYPNYVDEQTAQTPPAPPNTPPEDPPAT